MINTYFSRIDLAERWGVRPNTVWNWSKRDNEFPRPVSIVQQGRVHIYALADVQNYERLRSLGRYAHAQQTQGVR
jgi:hypothetical protein